MTTTDSPTSGMTPTQPVEPEGAEHEEERPSDRHHSEAAAEGDDD